MPEPANTAPNTGSTIILSLVENKCESFTLTPEALKVTAPLAFDQYEFKFTISVNFNQTTRHARVNAGVKLREKRDNADGIELAELKSVQLFLVENFSEIIQFDPHGQLIIPNELVQLFHQVALSTARGMYSIKLQDTIFSNAVLPLIHPDAFLQAPASI